MTDNEIISRWYYKDGPCDKWRATHSPLWGFKKGQCEHENCIAERLWPRQFDKYAELWTPELYQEIEEKGLVERFSEQVYAQIFGCLPADDTNYSSGLMSDYEFQFIKSTPAQKSQALARAIMEVSQ